MESEIMEQRRRSEQEEDAQQETESAHGGE
jgi:hypothetical protein